MRLPTTRYAMRSCELWWIYLVWCSCVNIIHKSFYPMKATWRNIFYINVDCFSYSTQQTQTDFPVTWCFFLRLRIALMELQINWLQFLALWHGLVFIFNVNLTFFYTYNGMIFIWRENEKATESYKKWIIHLYSLSWRANSFYCFQFQF